MSGVAAVHRGGRGRHDQRKREPGGVFDGSVSLSGAHGRVGRVGLIGLGWVGLLKQVDIMPPPHGVGRDVGASKPSIVPFLACCQRSGFLAARIL